MIQQTALLVLDRPAHGAGRIDAPFGTPTLSVVLELLAHRGIAAVDVLDLTGSRPTAEVVRASPIVRDVWTSMPAARSVRRDWHWHLYDPQPIHPQTLDRHPHDRSAQWVTPSGGWSGWVRWDEARSLPSEPVLHRRLEEGRAPILGVDVLSGLDPVARAGSSAWDRFDASRALLLAEVGYRMPAGVEEVEPGVFVAPRARIHSTAALFGPCFIGEDTRIEAGVTIAAGSVVGARCRIGRDATLFACVVESDSCVRRRAEVSYALLDGAFSWGAWERFEGVSYPSVTHPEPRMRRAATSGAPREPVAAPALRRAA